MGLYVRSRLEESPAFREMTESREVPTFPLKDTLRRSLRSVLVGIFAQVGTNRKHYASNGIGTDYVDQMIR